MQDKENIKAKDNIDNTNQYKSNVKRIQDEKYKKKVRLVDNKLKDYCF